MNSRATFTLRHSKDQRRYFLPTFAVVFLFILYYYWLPAQVSPVETEKSSDLTDANFHSTISEGWWLIEFYNPHCSVCQSFAPIWHEATVSSKIPSVAGMAKVDVTIQKDLATLYEISAIPAIKLFHNAKEVAHYTGDRSIKNMEDFVENEIAKFEQNKK